jgi:hypothetical protein
MSSHVDIQAGDEVVAAGRDPGRQITLDPGDALGDVRAHGLGRRPGVREGGRGEVDRRYLPSARGKPKRVGPLTAARVEGQPGAQVHCLGGQMCIWGAMRDSMRVLAQDSRPAAFPEAPVERRHLT